MPQHADYASYEAPVIRALGTTFRRVTCGCGQVAWLEPRHTLCHHCRGGGLGFSFWPTLESAIREGQHRHGHSVP